MFKLYKISISGVILQIDSLRRDYFEIKALKATALYMAGENTECNL